VLQGIGRSPGSVSLGDYITFKARVKNTGTLDVYVHVVFIVYDSQGNVVDGAATTTTVVEPAGDGPVHLSKQWLADPIYVVPGTYRVEGTLYYSQDGVNFVAGNSLDTTFSVR
jgi:hypothetical protein